MNKIKKITRDNIDDTEMLIKKLLCYFARWRNKTVERYKTYEWEKNGQTHSCQT